MYWIIISFLVFFQMCVCFTFESTRDFLNEDFFVVAFHHSDDVMSVMMFSVGGGGGAC